MSKCDCYRCHCRREIATERRRCITYESAAAHASRTRSGKGLSAPYGRRDSGVGGSGSHARPSAAFECYAGLGARLAGRPRPAAFVKAPPP